MESPSLQAEAKMNEKVFLEPQSHLTAKHMNITTLILASAVSIMAPVQSGVASLAHLQDETPVEPSENTASDTENVEETPPASIPAETTGEATSSEDEGTVSAPGEAADSEPSDTQSLGYIQTAGSRAVDWLSEITSLSGRFEQVAPNGAITTGALALERPGKIRFDYDDPSPILLVADGASVAIADFELETVDRVPIAATPLRFLLDDPASLVETGAIGETGYTRNRLYVTLLDPEGQIDGQITLVFEDPNPLQPASAMTLLGWYALDAMGGTTELRLSELETGMSFDPRLFILDDEDVTGADTRRRRR